MSIAVKLSWCEWQIWKDDFDSSWRMKKIKAAMSSEDPQGDPADKNAKSISVEDVISHTE